MFIQASTVGCHARCPASASDVRGAWSIDLQGTAEVSIIRRRVLGSFQKSGALTYTPNSSYKDTHTRAPQFIGNSHLHLPLT